MFDLDEGLHMTTCALKLMTHRDKPFCDLIFRLPWINRVMMAIITYSNNSGLLKTRPWRKTLSDHKGITLLSYLLLFLGRHSKTSDRKLRDTLFNFLTVTVYAYFFFLAYVWIVFFIYFSFVQVIVPISPTILLIFKVPTPITSTHKTNSSHLSIYFISLRYYIQCKQMKLFHFEVNCSTRCEIKLQIRLKKKQALCLHITLQICWVWTAYLLSDVDFAKLNQMWLSQPFLEEFRFFGCHT